MKSSKRLSVIAILAFIGAAISLYQSYHFFEIRNAPEAFQSFCTFGASFDCDAIELSRWAEIIPGLPLSALAAGWLFLLGLIALFAKDPLSRRDGLRAVFALSVVGVLFSSVFFFVMASILKKWCLLCLIIDGINVTIFALVLSLKSDWSSKQPFDRKILKQYGMTALITLSVAILVSKMFDQSPIDKDREDLLVDRTVTTKAVHIDIGPESISIGPEDAPLTIVKFSDYQCPACKMGALSFHPILRKYKDQIRFVSKNFPLSAKCNPIIESAMHPYACGAARVAICANQQGRFLEVYEAFFENQSDLDEENVIKIAVSKGLDENKLKECIQSEKTKEQLTREITQANNIPIKSTPTFFINGHKVEGATPTKVWMRLVEYYLKNPS